MLLNGVRWCSSSPSVLSRRLVLVFHILVLLCPCPSHSRSSSSSRSHLEGQDDEQDRRSDKSVYTNGFAVEILGGSAVAEQVANDLGYRYLGQVMPGEDIYHFEHESVMKRSILPSLQHHKSLVEEHRVSWFQQQKGRSRVKRSVTQVNFNDPKWSQMWYLNRGHDQDMNVEEAWAIGVTGKDIVITILDDGLEHEHPDLIDNYDPWASFDVNHNDTDPQPRYDLSDSNRHGTRCAGEIAAKPNNNICTVGVAYESKVGGVRMLDGDVTDVVEAKSLSLNPQHIDIYSASWGPDDDGRTVDGPGRLATKAFINGILKGRGGLGSIFVWASGNGGRDLDNCNCDGYTNSIWTLSISSATENGLVPWYSEACSSSLATTYSSGSNGESQVITTDLHHGCTSHHTGTSASAPLAAGICALALQANRKLTWRDMQHIVVRTARPAKLFAKDWAVNGVGRKVSHSFGYGLMDAAAMVKLAKTWKTVPRAKECEVRAHHIDKVIPAKSHVELTLEINTCEHVNFLEHVQAKISLATTRRGDIRIYLISPRGTRSTLLALRPHDSSRSGFAAWPFMTVHNWGENPRGKWILEVHNEGRYFGRATLREWSLILYGTTHDPDNPDAPVESTTKTSTASTEATYESTTSSTLRPWFRPTTTMTTTTETPKQISTVSLKPIIPEIISDNNIDHLHVLKPDSDQVSVLDFTHLQYGEQVKSVGNISSESCTLISNGRCLGCSEPYHLFYGACVWHCPIAHYSATNTGKHGVSLGLVCRPCHYSCKRCSGSQDYQCDECFDDAALYRSYCYSREAVSKLNHFDKWQLFTIICFVILFATLISLVVYLFCLRNPQKTLQMGTSSHQYSQLKTENGSNGQAYTNKSKAVFRDDSDEDSMDEF